MADYTSTKRNEYSLLLRMVARSRSQADIDANRTIVDWTLYLRTHLNAINARTVGSITVAGSATSIPMATRNFPNNNTSYVIVSGTRTVTHNSNGVASCYGTAHFYSENQTAVWRIPRLDVNGTLSLSRIDQFPNAPGAPTASQGNLQITVTSKTAGANGGTITGYQIRRRNNGSGTWSAWTETTADSNRQIKFNPAEHGKTYQFQARARTGRGWGPWSSTTSLTTKTQIPNAPGAPTISQGSLSVTVTRANATANGQPVTQYEMRRRAYVNGAWTSWTTTNMALATTVSFNPTYHGTLHEFQVRATSGYGWGPWSTAVALTTKTQIPNKPSAAPTATQGTLAITATSAVASPNGQPVTSYEIRYRYLRGSSWSNWSTVTANSSRQITIASPVSGATYEFQSRANAGYGWGPYSDTRTLVAKDQIPNAPSSAPTVAQAGNNGQINATSSTASSTGAPVIGYEIEYRSFLNGSWSNWTRLTPAAGSRSITINPPQHGIPMEFRSRAFNEFNHGPYSASTSFNTQPKATISSVSDQQPTSLRVTFSPTGGTAGGTRWEIQRATNSSFSANLQTQTSTGTSVIFSGLTPGTMYYFRVRGTNSGGVGAYSQVVSAQTPPSTPPNLAMQTAPTGTSAIAQITHTGMNVSRYYVEVALSSAPGTIVRSGNSTSSSVTLTGLTPGTLYVARAWTMVGAYTSPKTAWVTFATPNPGAVTSDYFDGSSTDLADLDYQWNGTAHGSYSKAVGKLPLRTIAELGGAYTLPGSLFSGGGRLIRWVSTPTTIPGVLYFLSTPGDLALFEVSEVVTYTFSLYIRAAQDSQVTMLIHFQDQPVPGAPIIDTASQTYDLEAGNTARINVTGTSPLGATHAILQISTVTHGYFDIDGVMFSPGGLIPYFDGDMVDTSTDTYVWLGTPNDSVSEHVSIPGEAVDYFEDPSCPRPPAAPRPPAIENPCLEEVSAWRRYWVHIEPSQLKAHIDALPTFSILTGSEPESNVRIRIYPNPEGLPTNDFIPGEPLSEQILVNLPPNAEVVLDALSERASGTVNGSPWQSVDHLVFGSDGRPPSYPVLSCGTPYLVAFDVPLESPAGNLTFEAELVERYG